MRRINIVIDPELDDRLEREAAQRGTSKSALVRECVALGLASGDAAARDPLWRLVGSDDGEPVADLDEVIYGQ